MLKKSVIVPEQDCEKLHKTMHNIPKGATHWSLRLMSRYVGVSPYLVGKVWKAAGLKPHLTSTFNFSKDPDFADKVMSRFVVAYNKYSAKPFVWTKAAEQVLASVENAKQLAEAQTPRSVM